MSYTTRKLLTASCVALTVSGVISKVFSESASTSIDSKASPLALQVGTEAYLYGVPVVQMNQWRDRYFLRHSITNQFFHFRDFEGTNAPSVPAPNTDVLYSVAWLDLTKEPIILSVPDMRGRYYSFQSQNFFGDNEFYVSSRYSAPSRKHYAYVGPGWEGKLPKGVQRLDNATRWIALIGRTYVANRADLPNARTAQDSYCLSPLSKWSPDDCPSVAKPNPAANTPSAATAGMDETEANDPLQFFATLDQCLRENPPTFDYALPMQRFSQLGIGTGQPFHEASLDEATRKELLRAIVDAKKLIASERASWKTVNGWLTPPLLTSDKRTALALRAAIATSRVGINSARECYYLVGSAGDDGKPLASPGSYRIHFPKDQLPPVNGFWSVAVYQANGRTLVSNPLGRYALKSLDPALRHNADGSITMYLGKESPGTDHESNWLPTPDGEFVIILRLYDPQLNSSNPKWQPPAIHRHSP